MHIAVLLAGVADPKKLLPKPSSNAWHDLPAEATVSYKLSPFDEAALEIALTLRDQGVATFVTALITDGAHDVTLMRAVGALKPNAVRGLCPPPPQRNNPAWLAHHTASLLGESGTWPELILIGREHGDLDDGMTPAYLAESWQLPFASQALQVQAAPDGGWSLLRSGSQQDESWHLPAPAMVSISNDKNNRLRHPLMKNVALAKQMIFELVAPDAATPAPAIALAKAALPPAAGSGEHRCHMLTGSVQEQAIALAAYLRAPLAQGSHHVQ